MIITAMYIYGLTQGSWEFSLMYIMICFLADIVLVRILSSNVRVNVVNKISDEEKYYWKKRGEFEGLRIDELEKQLYGKK